MKKILNQIDMHLEEWIGMALLCAIVALTFIQVIMRYVIGNSLSFSEEAARYLFVWLTFIGVSYGAKNASHMKVDMFVGLMPKPVQKVLSVIASLCYFAFICTAFYYSCELVSNMAAKRNYSPTMPWFHMKWLYAATIVGFGLATFRMIELWVKKFIANKKAVSDEKGSGEV